MNRKSHIMILKILMTAAIMVLLVLMVDLGSITASFRSMRVPYGLMALLLLPVNLFVQCLRWRLMLGIGGQASPWKEIRRSVLGGLTLSLVTPGRIGELGRSLFLTSSRPVTVAGLVILEKTFAFLTTCLVASLSLILWHRVIPGMVLLALAVGIIFHLHVVRSALTRISFLLPYGGKIAGLWTGWASFGRRQIGLMLAVSLLFFTIVFLQFFLLVTAFEPVGIIPALIAIPLSLAANCVPITIAGLGVREGAAVLLFSAFGVAGASALNGALLLFVIDILLPGLIGLSYVPRMHIPLGQGQEMKTS